MAEERKVPTAEELKAFAKSKGKEMTDEQAANAVARLERLASVNTAEEAKAFAKESGQEITDEQAAEIVAKLKGWENGELSDEELAAVSGGASVWKWLACIFSLGIVAWVDYLG